METSLGGVVYRFEGFYLDGTRGILRSRSDEEVRLRHKSFELLRLFVENAGHLLNRDSINQAIWSDVIVNDDSITQCVRDIRRALGDESQAILKTVPRRGYIFAVKVTSHHDLGDNQLIGGTAPMSDKPSIAVLAFTNMSADPEQEYFSDGMAEDITTQLSRSRALFVIARNSSFTYKGRAVDVKQIGRELGVRYVLEGSVRRAGERVRISAQLVEAETGNHMWAERYDRSLADMFAVQDEISDAVATAIGPAVADAEMGRAIRRPPGSLDAWELYQRGVWYLGKTDAAGNAEARRLFELAIDQDPLFAAAYARLSLACAQAGTQHFTLPFDEAQRSATMHARKAVALDPGDADTHAALALASARAGDMSNGLETARRAFAINPNCAQAHWVMGIVLIFTGQPAAGREALGVFERLSPRDATIATAHRQIAMAYYFEHDYERCVDVLRRLLSVHTDIPWIDRWLAAALGQLGRTDEARAALERTIAESPREIDVYVRNRVPWFRPEDHEHMLDGLRKAGWQG